MIKYDKYKPSGIDWLGDIPENWEVNNLKRLCSLIKDGTHGSFKRVDFGYPLLSVRNIVDSCFVLLDDDSQISKDDFLSITNSFKIKENDIQLAIVGATMGKVAIITKLPPFATQRSLSTIRTISKLLFSKFLFYYIQSSKFQGFLWANTSYSAQPGIYLGTIQNIGTPVPSIIEQTAITTYLDNKTQAIDKKIEILTKKTNHYKELRKSLINQTVCRGLNKNVKLKDSGIEWIGKIPEHWQVNRLKSLGCIETSSVNKKIEENEGLVKLVNYTDIYNNPKKEIWNDDSYMVVSANIKQLKSKKLQQGNVLFTPSSETIEDIGVSAVVMEDLENTLYSYHILRFKFQKDIFLNFKKYLLNNDFVQYYFSKSASGTTRKILGLNIFYNLPVLLPPTIEEQTQIANFLDQKTQIIDSIVNNIQKQIAVLKELRKTLINDAVTGKIKVIP